MSGFTINFNSIFIYFKPHGSILYSIMPVTFMSLINFCKPIYMYI